MHNNKIAAVDFGSKKFSISFGVNKGEGIEILGYLAADSSGIEKGLIKDEVKCTKSFRSLLDDFEKKIKEPVKEIYAGISCRNLRISETVSEVSLKKDIVTYGDIKRALRHGRKLVNMNENEEIVDSIINFYVLDENPVFDDVVGWKGHKLKVNITYFIGNKEEIQKFKNVIENAGCLLKGFIVNIYSGKQVFLSGRNSNDVRVLIDAGAGVSDYAVFKDGILKEIGSIPLGGNNVTNDLAICGEYSKREAENIKLICADNYVSLHEHEDEGDIIEIGINKVSKNLFYEVTMARLEEMLKLLNSKLKNSSYYEDICSIILYGDGMTYYENINDIANNEFEKKVRIITKDYLGMKNSLNITSLAIVKEVSDRINLLHRDMEKEREIEYLLDSKKEREQPKVEEHNKKSIVCKIKKVLGDIF